MSNDYGKDRFNYLKRYTQDRLRFVADLLCDPDEAVWRVGLDLLEEVIPVCWELHKLARPAEDCPPKEAAP